jgi:hypothetical protein
MRQFIDTTTRSLRSPVDIGPGGASEQRRHSNDQRAVTTGNVDSARRSLLRPGALARSGALAMSNEERVQQSPHRCLLLGIEQFRGLEGEFETGVVTESARSKDEFITGRRKCGCQLAQYAERGFGLARFIEADLIGEHVERLRERRLGEATFSAQRRQILGKSHAPIYLLRTAPSHVILIISV